MGPEATCIQSDTCYPFIHQARALSRADGSMAIAAARKQKFTTFLAEGPHIFIECLTCLLGQFKSNWLTCFLLAGRRPFDCVSVWSNVLDLKGDHIAAA